MNCRAYACLPGTGQEYDRDSSALPVRELQGIEQLLQSVTASQEEESVQSLLKYCLPGGKRLRARLVVTVATCGPHSPEQVQRVGAAIELIHLASLVHDDLLDGASTRRSRLALYRICGPTPAVLAGDYLFAAAFGLLSDAPQGILRKVTRAIQAMCTGEITELLRSDCSEAGYYRRVEKKTAVLIAAACFSGAILAGMDQPLIAILETFGHHLGMAFQIADDLLDLEADPAVTGKDACQDIRQGVVTLPLIHFFSTVPPGSPWQEKLAAGPISREETEVLVAALRETGSLEYARQQAARHVSLALQALEQLPPTQARDTLAHMATDITRADTPPVIN